MLQDTYSHWREGYLYRSDYEDEPPVVMERIGHFTHSAQTKERWLHLDLWFRVDEWRQDLKEKYPEARVRIDQCRCRQRVSIPLLAHFRTSP